MRDWGKPLGRAMQAAAFSIVYSCTPQVPTNSVPPRLPPPMVSTWERGTCSFSDPVLEYREFASEATGRISLDSRPEEPRRLMCSTDFTVIIERTHAVVALGGESVIDGREMLGTVGDRFTPANSYSLNLREPAGERIIGSAVAGGNLRIDTAAGNRWTIDLRSPDEWLIYTIQR